MGVHTVVEDAQGEGKPEDSVKTEIVQKELAETKKAFELPPDLQIPAAKPTIDIDKEVMHVIKDTGIKFNDPEIEKRFKNIVKSSLKKVRSLAQTREIFTSSMLEGGMGFDSQVTDKVVTIIKKHLAHLDEKVLKEVSKDESVDIQAQVDNLAVNAQGKRVTKPEPIIAFAPNSEPDKSIIDRAKEADKEEQARVDKVASEAPVQTEPLTVLEPEPITMPQPIVSNSPDKPKIQDVKFEPKLTGPVEEIRTMTLTDFRRFSPDPKQAIEKILGQINLLEEESFTRKTEAVKAWKENEINRMYIGLGDRSMEKRKPISDIITELQAAGQETLTNDELEAVVELNQRLRY